MQVARWHLGGIALGPIDLFLIFPRADVLGSHQRRGLATGAREGRVTHRVRPIGHLESSQWMAVRVSIKQSVDGLRSTVKESQLDVDRLSADEMARPRHDVQRRQAAGQCSPKSRVADIQRFIDTDTRLDGTAAVGRADAADVTVRAHQARHDGAALTIDDVGTLGNVQLVGRADGRDLAAFHQEGSVFQFRARGGNDLGVGKGREFREGSERQHHQECQGGQDTMCETRS